MSIHRRKVDLLKEIAAVRRLIDVECSDELITQEELLMKELDLVLEQEETLWYQKSWEKWIALGDRNTSFFHTSTIIRKRKNWVEMFRLYSIDDVPTVVNGLPMGGFAQLTHVELGRLSKPFTVVEVEFMVHRMGQFNASWPDGYPSVFYQNCWEVVGGSVVRFVLDFFSTGSLPRATNDAPLVLIAKVAKPERIKQFRPISLCNVLFKVITKTMVIRLKEVISKLIGPSQSSFIPGRLSTDNIVIVQEAVHSMRRFILCISLMTRRPQIIRCF
ncbi:hypothetical protein V2J09_010369 [Rumex salicifolius]